MHNNSNVVDICMDIFGGCFEYNENVDSQEDKIVLVLMSKKKIILLTVIHFLSS